MMTFMHRNLFDALWRDIVVDNSLVVFLASISQRPALPDSKPGCIAIATTA